MSASHPPARQDSDEFRSGLRVAILVCILGLLIAVAYMLTPLVSPSHDKTPATGEKSRPAARPHLSYSTLHSKPMFATNASLSSLMTTAQLSGTNARVRAACTNNVRLVHGIANGTMTGATGTNHVAHKLPIFDDLRAGLGQPVPKDVATLAKDITKDCKTDADKARAIYNWITDHITYDWKVWSDIVAGATTYTEPQDPLSVMKRGTGVCIGYSWLFTDMAQSVGLPSDSIIGDVRGYRGTADDQLISPYQHAWNWVSIDGNQVLLDSTWGATQGSSESPADFAARRDYYFATPPAQLIFDHLPESSDMQMLANPVAENAFDNLPNLKPAFFQDGLKLDPTAFSPTLQTITGQPGDVILSTPAGIQLAASLLNANGQDISSRDTLGVFQTPLQRGNIRQDVVISSLPPGDYLLRIYAGATTATSLQCFADYAIKILPKP
jgi:transglutaminase/protease-like cytokinesis protein 3